jgi:hypothetical protein
VKFFSSEQEMSALWLYQVNNEDNIMLSDELPTDFTKAKSACILKVPGYLRLFKKKDLICLLKLREKYNFYISEMDSTEQSFVMNAATYLPVEATRCLLKKWGNLVHPLLTDVYYRSVTTEQERIRLRMLGDDMKSRGVPDSSVLLKKIYTL